MSDVDDATPRVPGRMPTGADGVLEVRQTGDATRIVVTADLDMHTARHARSVIDAVCDARPSNVVIDLSRLEFVDSHGLHLVVLAHRTLTAAGCSIALVAPPAHIRRAFAIAGLDGLFPRRNGNGRGHVS
jgi:anti-anti-sigma factor